MSIVSLRIDNRLLHGIVATQWAPLITPSRIMVIDNEVADDAMLKNSMRLGKPAGMALSIINESVALDHFSKHMYDSQKVFVIVRHPQIILNMLNSGLEIPSITLGGTVNPDDLNSAIKISSRAYITQAELPIYKAILESGTPIFSQYVPSDKSIDVSTVIKES